MIPYLFRTCLSAPKIKLPYLAIRGGREKAMKKTREYITTTYKADEEGFCVDIVQRINNTYDAWIYEESYGIKMYMFGNEIGRTKSCKTYNEFLDLVDANIENYINIYREEYLCPFDK